VTIAGTWVNVSKETVLVHGAYVDLEMEKELKNDSDLVDYFREVQRRRVIGAGCYFPHGRTGIAPRKFLNLKRNIDKTSF
jgi:hypothetical protein